MRTRHQKLVDRILGDETLLCSEKVEFGISVGNVPSKGRVLCTPTRLLFYVRTPMGMQLTVVWYKEVETLTSGKKKGIPYVQLLGQGSRILVLFRAKEACERFKKLCSARTTP